MDDPIRVLSVLDSLEVGGVREVVGAQLTSLDKTRFEAGVMTLGGDLERHRAALPEGVTALGPAYRPARGYRVMDYLLDAFLLRAAKRSGGTVLTEIMRFSPDILHFHTNPRELALGILAKRRAACALVFTDHLVRLRSDDYSASSRFLMRAAYRRLYWHYNVISVGESVGRCNADWGFLNPNHAHTTLGNEVDLARFHPRSTPAPAGPLEIIYVGRIHPVKGIDTLIRAFARLEANRPLRLVLVGPDATGGRMAELAGEEVSEPLEVQFLGSRMDVPDLLRRAAIAVLPSRREGLSLALLEQMASALPVVVSDLPENLEMVVDRVNGMVFPVDDVQGLSQVLQDLIDQPDLRNRLGNAARESVERRIAAQPAARLQAFYERLMAAPRRAS